MEDASISQTTTDTSDELTEVVRKAIECLPVKWQQLHLDDEIDQEEIEGIMSGDGRATPRVAHFLANGLGLLASGIHNDLEIPIWEALQRSERGWHRDDLTTTVRMTLLLDAVSLDTLELYEDALPRDELEAVLAGTRAVSPSAARIFLRALTWLMEDIESSVKDGYRDLTRLEEMALRADGS